MTKDEAVALTEVLSAIWAEALDVPVVGLDGNFFELGGYSLLAMQVMSRVAELLDLRVTVRMLFDNPRFGDFVAEVGRCLSPEHLARVAGLVEAASESVSE